jgi:hypothetical protein
VIAEFGWESGHCESVSLRSGLCKAKRCEGGGKMVGHLSVQGKGRSLISTDCQSRYATGVDQPRPWHRTAKGKVTFRVESVLGECRRRSGLEKASRKDFQLPLQLYRETLENVIISVLGLAQQIVRDDNESLLARSTQSQQPANYVR